MQTQQLDGTYSKTHSEWIARLSRIALTLTQDQIEACAYVMGSMQEAWTPESISDELKRGI